MPDCGIGYAGRFTRINEGDRAEVLRSEVPIIVFVSPSGANAGSAGCFITLAADVAAMAPNTSIGAAHPVSMGPGGSEKLDDVMKTKLENFATSYIEAIADKRGRNVEWAKSSVKESASITAEKALELKVIDLIARDVPDLLKQVEGKNLNGKVLHTAGASVVKIPMAARERLFQLLWRPEVMLILMLAAIYGIIGELSNPGAVLPGVVGAIALVLVLYMSSILPINIAGIALIGLAFLLFLIDVYAPTHGVLTFGGVIAFFLGALMLFNRSDPAFRAVGWDISCRRRWSPHYFSCLWWERDAAQKLPTQAGPETMFGKATPALTAIGT